MSFRLVATPIEGAGAGTAGVGRVPAERPGGFDAALLDAFLPAPGVEETLARLREPGALAVTTGQQPALFTGPLYTVYKALSAAALARTLEARWGRPVVPVFWSAGDDHDFAEASHAAWFRADGSLGGAELSPRPVDAPLTPLYRTPLGGSVRDALAALAADLPASEFRSSTVDWLDRHFRPDATVAAASGGALAELLAPLGIVCLDGSHAAVKRAASRLLLRALAAAPEIDRELVRRRDALLAAGAADPGVAVGDGATLVMYEGQAGRDRLVVGDGGFVTRRGGERLSLAALERIADETPELLSPNVLLRPVVESAILPTVAYVAGPGELRYLRLAEAVYASLDVRRQLPVPRWSGVVVERRVDRVLERYELALDELRAPVAELEARIVRGELAGEAELVLQRLREEARRSYDALARIGADIDPTLVPAMEGLGKRALQITERAERKLVQRLRRRHAETLAQLGRARTAVLPAGRPQERVVTIASFLGRYGESFLAEVDAAIREWYASALEGSAIPT